MRNLAARVGYELPDGWRLCGENLWAKHSIEYNNLESYFYLFSIWDEKNNCLNWDQTLEWAKLLDIVCVPTIYDGIYNESKIKESFEPYRKDHEGYVVRLAEQFHYSEFKYSLGKFVRSNHVQTSNHWKFEKIEKNLLKK